MTTTLKDLIKSINKLSSTYYSFSSSLLKSAAPISEQEVVKDYFNKLINDTGQVLQFLQHFPFEKNPVAKLAVYFLYESLKLLSTTGEGVNETLSLISYIKSQILKTSDSGEGYSLFDASRSDVNKELFAIQTLMDKDFSVSNLDGRILGATKALFPGKNVESLKSSILTNIPAQLSVKKAPESFVKLQSSLPPINWQEYLSTFEGDVQVEGTAHNIGMDLAGIGVALNNMSAELNSARQGDEDGGPSAGKLNLSTFGKRVNFLINKSENAERIQNAIVIDYSKKLEELNNKIKSGELPIQLVRQARETRTILENLVEASNNLKQLIKNRLQPLSGECDRLYTIHNEVLKNEPAYLASEDGKKELQDSLDSLNTIMREYADIYNKVCTAYDRVRYFKYQLDIVESATISASNYKTVIEGLKTRTIEYVDEDGSNVKRPGSIEDITRIQEINRAIVEDRKDYHLRGANRVNLVTLMTELFGIIGNREISESGLNDAARLIGKIYTIEQKALEESKVKRQENIEAKRKADIKIYERKEKRISGNLGLLESTKNIIEELMKTLGGNRNSKAKQAFVELLKVFKDPISFQTLVPDIERTESRDVFANLRIRILLEAFKVSKDPAHQEAVRIFSKDDKIAISPAFREFVLKSQIDLSTINNEAFGELIKQTYAKFFTTFIREIFVSEVLSQKIVNSNAKLTKIKKEFIAFDETSHFIDTQISRQYLKPYEGASEAEEKEYFAKYTKEKAEALKTKLEEAKIIAEPTKSEAFISKIMKAIESADSYIKSFTSATVISPESVEEEIDTELSGAVPETETVGDESAMISLLEGMYDLDPNDIRDFVKSEDFANIAKNPSENVRAAAIELSKILEQNDILDEAETFEPFQLEDFVNSGEFKELLRSKSSIIRNKAKSLKQNI